VLLTGTISKQGILRVSCPGSAKVDETEILEARDRLRRVRASRLPAKRGGPRLSPDRDLDVLVEAVRHLAKFLVEHTLSGGMGYSDEWALYPSEPSRDREACGAPKGTSAASST
jgi:hypothetical protein